MKPKANPDMVILAREARNLTQRNLADALETTQGYVSKVEAGLIVLSEEHLTALARVLRYPEQFFLQSDAVYGYGSSCLYHRKRQNLPAGDLRRIIAEVNILRIGISRLLRSVEIRPAHGFHRMDIADYGGSPEHIANLVRGSWCLPRGPVQNLTRSIENAGGIVVRCSFGTSKLDAISQWVPSSPPLFFANSDVPNDRFRFSLAHELGHVIMHQVPTNDLEREADRFASEFLMPARDVGPQLTPVSIPRLAQLKPYWKVSIAALAKRSYDLGKITPRHYRTIFTQMGKAGIRLHEPVEIPPEDAELLETIITAHRRDHDYSIAELSHLVCLHEDEFRQRYLREAKQIRLVG